MENMETKMQTYDKSKVDKEFHEKQIETNRTKAKASLDKSEFFFLVTFQDNGEFVHVNVDSAVNPQTIVLLVEAMPEFQHKLLASLGNGIIDHTT